MTTLSNWDIALLDVELGSGACTGLELAAKLRQAWPDGLILLVTNYISYAVAGYEVRAWAGGWFQLAAELPL